jgi:hypothetical protein
MNEDDRQFYAGCVRAVILREKSTHNQLVLSSIVEIMEAQKNVRRRQTLWNHFEKTVRWELKSSVAQLHELYNEIEDEQQKVKPAVTKPKAVVAEAELCAV